MQDMMKMHEQMMAEMKASDAKLDALLKDMNSVSGDARVTAMAAVVNELVRQHKAMHARMGQMHQQMMGGRGGAMAPGAAAPSAGAPAAAAGARGPAAASAGAARAAPAFLSNQSGWLRPQAGAGGATTLARTSLQPDRAPTVRRGGFGRSGAGRSAGG